MIKQIKCLGRTINHQSNWEVLVNYFDVLDNIFENINKEYGTDVEVPKE